MRNLSIVLLLFAAGCGEPDKSAERVFSWGDVEFVRDVDPSEFDLMPDEWSDERGQRIKPPLFTDDPNKGDAPIQQEPGTDRPRIDQPACKRNEKG